MTLPVILHEHWSPYAFSFPVIFKVIDVFNGEMDFSSRGEICPHHIHTFSIGHLLTNSHLLTVLKHNKKACFVLKSFGV